MSENKNVSKKKSIGTLGIMSRMSDDNNQELKCVPLQNMKSAHSGKDGWGEITLAIPNEVVQHLLIDPDYYVGGLLFVSREEFDKYKKGVNAENE
jgi:hypothetical protein